MYKAAKIRLDYEENDWFHLVLDSCRNDNYAIHYEWFFSHLYYHPVPYSWL